MGMFRRRKNFWAKDVIKNETEIKSEQLNGSVVGDIIYKETFSSAPKVDTEFGDDIAKSIADNCNAGFSGEMKVSNHTNNSEQSAKANDQGHTHNSEFAEDYGKLESVDPAASTRHCNCEFAEDTEGEFYDAEFAEDMEYREHYSEFAGMAKPTSSAGVTTPHYMSEYGDITDGKHYDTEFADDINEYLTDGVTDNAPYHNTAEYRMVTPSSEDESTVDTNLS